MTLLRFFYLFFVTSVVNSQFSWNYLPTRCPYSDVKHGRQFALDAV
jgi:hypothetical protein